jgi:hypothetical protein
MLQCTSGLCIVARIEGDERLRRKKLAMKTERILSLANSLNATPSRIVTEILKGGWEATGFSGKSCTTASQRRGLKGFAEAIRARGFDAGVLWRMASGARVSVLPLP